MLCASTLAEDSNGRNLRYDHADSYMNAELCVGTLFYSALKSEFESYLRELRDPDNDDLRKRFKKNMNELCKKT